MEAPSHNYNTRYRLKRLASQLNEEEEAPQQPQEDSINGNVNVHDSAVNAPGSPPKEQLHIEDSSNNKNAGRRRITYFDMIKPRPRPRKLSYELNDSDDALMDNVDIIDNESELSDFIDENPDLIPNTSEDYEYEDIREYSKVRNVYEPVYTNYLESLNIMQKYLKDYWECAKLSNESRSKIINELNGQLSKSKKFSEVDVTYFNEIIGLIELNLNASTPVISKLKATYIRDSLKQQVLYQGFKFSRHYCVPTIYKCTYDDDPNWEMFGRLTSCKAALIIDEKGFLQPGSFVLHYHGGVKEGYKVRDLASPKIDYVASPRLTSEGDIAGKRIKLNQFLSKKLQESLEYIKEVSRILPKKYIVNEKLEKLRLINGPELQEKEQNYLSSYIKWIEYLLHHIKIVKMANEKNVQVAEKEGTTKGGVKENNKKQRKEIKKNY